MDLKHIFARSAASMRNYQIISSRRAFVYVLAFVSLLLVSSSLEGATVVAQEEDGAYIRQARVLEVSDFGILNPAGLAFSPAANAFHVVEARQQMPTSSTDIVKLTSAASRAGTARIGATINDPINVAFDGRYNRLLIFQPESNQLVQVLEVADGNLDPATLARHDARHFALEDPQGMTVDPVSGDLFILDSAGPRILRVEPESDGGFGNARISEVDLRTTGLVDPRGLAYDPATGHLHILSPAEQALYELTLTGQVVAKRDLTEFGLANPRAIVFAPSSDLTDDPSQMSLYLAESGGDVLRGPENTQDAETTSGGSSITEASAGSDTGDILEFTFVQAVEPAAATFQSFLIQTINAYQWSPPSPDASGVVYLPASDTLMVVDGEVNEMPIYDGANVFESSLTGNLINGWTTLDFSNEPTGVSVNPANGHLFISQDTRERLVHEIDPGSDGEYGTADDVVTSLITADFGSNDPEGVTYAPDLNVLFVADGVNNEIYRIEPGSNGIFDGVSPAGDDQVTSFDTSSLGLQDPEGVAYNPDNGNLYISGNSDTDLLEVTVDGVLVQTIDVSTANATQLSGLGYGPSSVDPYARVLYIADRGVDNNNDPNENDGKIYELTLPVYAPAPPVANDDSATTAENTAVTIDVVLNDTDLNGNLDPASARVTSGPGNGALANNGDGTFTYTPNTGFTGVDSFIYEICDTDSLCDTATVSITVSVNDPPVANDDSASTGVGTTATIDVAANDTDPNGNLDPSSANTTCGTCALPLDGTLANNEDGTFNYTPNAGFSGSDSFVYQICDASGACDTATVTITVDNIVEARVSTSADDAEEQQSLSVGLTSSDLELILEDSNQTVGMRFTGLEIPQGATIASAYVQFQADETNSEVTSLIIQGEATDNALTFISSAGNISGRARTTAAVTWEPAPWLSKLDAGPEQRTPDVAPVIQEIVDRPGWRSGNSLALIITGTGKRVADSYDGDPAGAPLLHVEYTESGNFLPEVTIDGPALGSTYNTGDSITFSGTAVDSEDGDLTTSLVWESDLDGPIGSGSSFSRSDLSAGVHTVTATAADTDGQSAFDTVTITIFAPANVLVGAGDIADDGQDDEGTARLLETIPGTVFTLGDNAYETGTEADFNTYYDPTWGRHKSRTRPSAGNHDYLTPGAAPYFDYFGAAAGDPDKGYYSYDVGDWHIIVLNSQCSEVGGCASTDPQGLWLQADLSANPAACTLAYWHHPRFSSDGNNLEVQDFWSLLYDAGADVVLNGHEHSYERFALQDPVGFADPEYGIRQFVVGTGGRSLSPLVSSAPNSEVANSDSHGVLKLTLNPTGYDWEFIPVAGDTFTDFGSGTCVSPVVPNTAPVAADDTYATDEDTVLTIAAPGLLGNDSDVDGDPLTVTVDTAESNGSLGLNADGSFTYIPDADFNGTDSFSYHANDGALDSNVATVTINVNSVNDVPVAGADIYSTDEDVTLNVAAPGVLVNDSDVEDSSLTAVINTAPVNGTLTLNADGSFTYTPDADFSGTDSFTYHANDGTADSDPVTATITVEAVNDAPVAADDTYTTNEDTTLSVAAQGVLANDGDVEGDALTAVLDAAPDNGSLTLKADGSFTYIPNAEFSGTDTFSYNANDGTTVSNVATVNITVIAINDPPAAADDAYVTDEDTVLTVAAPGVLANDTDAESDSLSAVLSAGALNGTVTFIGDGSFSYTPNANFNGTDSFSYRAHDGAAESSLATVSITVNAVNDVPRAGDDAYTIMEDSTLTVNLPGLLSNDSDADGDSLTAVLDTAPGNGALTLNADGTFTYTPDTNFAGTESFTYKANDGLADSNVATVSITVSPINDAPVAADDAYMTDEDTVLTVVAPGVLGNDTDAENDPLTAVLSAGALNGTVTFTPDGSFSYTPNADFNGIDSFSYRAHDGAVESTLATVNITVNAVNDAPVAGDDAYLTQEGQPLAVAAPGVLDNDSDVDGDSLTAVLDAGPGNGTLTLNGDGSFTYTPAAGYVGEDTFTYRANDGVAGSNLATVTITVHPVNDAPVAVDDDYVADEDTTLTIVAPGVLANDADAESDPLTAALDAGPGNGTLNFNADGSFNYTPDADFNGSDSFTYHVSDGLSDSNLATVNITVIAVDDAPVAADDTYTTDEDSGLTVAAPAVLGNDSDGDGDSLTAVLDTAPGNGTLSLNADGSFSYTPDADFNGSDSFTYHANDGVLDSNIATVSITVSPVNDAPVAFADSATTDEDVAVTVAVLANDTDIDGDVLAVVAATQPANGLVVVEIDGTITYTPAANFNGGDSFTYDISDGNGASDTATVSVTVNAVNDAPVATGDSYTAEEDTTLNVPAPGVLANDTDAENESLTAELVTDASNGTLSLAGDGSFTYTPGPGFTGSDSFSYTSSDGLAASNVATVTIEVGAVNDAPVAIDDTYVVGEDAPLTISAPGVLFNDSDAEGDVLTAVLNTAPGAGTLALNADGSFDYMPNADFNGSDSFTYHASDGQADSNVATVNITVNPANDAPVATDDSATTNENTAVNIDVLANDSDVEGDSLSVTAATQPANGVVVVEADGTITYTPDADFSGIDSFTYDIGDGNGGTDTATVTVTISSSSGIITWTYNETLLVGSASGSYLDTQADDGVVEAITEQHSGGPQATRTDSLEARWVFDVPCGGPVSFSINAWVSESGDDGAFAFLYSTDDVTYTPWFTVSSTDPANRQVEVGPGCGTVYVQVKDVAQIPGNYTLDTINIDEMHFTTHTAGNASPSADFTFEVLGLEVAFSDASVDPDGQIASWEWDFGDGNTSTVQNPSHQYLDSGTYSVTLTVTDDLGAKDTTTAEVTVSAGGALSLTAVGYKVQGLQKVDLTWTGGSTANVEIYRDGQLIATMPNDGFYTDHIDARGSGSYSYQICEPVGDACSNLVTVGF